MSEDISDIALRLAGLIGQSTLDRMGTDPAAVAVLDQHIAAVHAALARSRSPRPAAPAADALTLGALDSGALGSGALGSGAPGSGAVGSGAVDSGARDSGARDSGGPGPALAGVTGPVPDDPDLCVTAPVGPGELLQYACGFLEASVGTGWQPALSDDEPADWRSLRLAAVCELITRARLAAEVHPDLRDLTWPSGPAL
jgi:hypothetical protein